MRKGFGLDARGADFNRDPDHHAILDAARQEAGQGEGKHRARVGSPADPGQSLREVPTQGLTP